MVCRRTVDLAPTLGYCLLPDDSLSNPSFHCRARCRGLRRQGAEYVSGLLEQKAKVRDAQKARGHAHSLRDGHSQSLPAFSESFFMPRVDYIHQNAARAGWNEQSERGSPLPGPRAPNPYPQIPADPMVEPQWEKAGAIRAYFLTPI